MKIVYLYIAAALALLLAGFGIGRMTAPTPAAARYQMCISPSGLVGIVLDTQTSEIRMAPFQTALQQQQKDLPYFAFTNAPRKIGVGTKD